MTGHTSHVKTQAAIDLAAPDHLPTCPTCSDLCPPDATRCECGERLQPRPYELPARKNCTCGVCTVCVLAELEAELRQ